jgi:hypothetical protein
VVVLAFVVVAMALAPMLLLIPLFVWARWLRRVPTAPPFVARVSHTLVALGALATVFGTVGSVWVVTVSPPAESEGASQKARMLARGISEGINCGALAILVALAAGLWLAFGTWRWGRARRGAR